jgi:hypothetical protein
MISVWVTKLSLNDPTVLWRYTYLEEINCDYSSINPNKMICRINRKDQTGKVGHLNCRNSRESVNILRHKLCCVSRNIFSRSKMRSEAGGHSLLDYLWNQACSTTVEKFTLNFWSIQAPYVIKLPEQVLCWGTRYSRQQDCCVCVCVCVHVYQHTQHGTQT